MRVDEVIESAQARTGIPGLHSDSFIEGLEIVVDTVNSDPQSPQRVRRITIEATKALMSRLRTDAWIAQHPEVVDAPVDRPVFVIGMPRTGTTILVNLMARDLERSRVLWHWEMDEPTPPVRPGHFEDDPRIAAKRAKLEPLAQRLTHFPRLELATDPVECVHILSQDFKSLTWDTATGCPTYNDWFLDEADLRSAYEHHRRTLQVLQSGGAGGQWVLKLPSHALHLEALLSVYPDARIVMTHRDPFSALVSMCSYAGMIHQANGNRVGLTELVGCVHRQVLESALRPVDFVDRHPEVPIFHLYQHELAADPIEQVRRLRAWLGLPLENHLIDEMRRYLEVDWPHPPGSHRYDASDFGLTRPAVHDEFARYLDRFDVPMEAK